MIYLPLGPIPHTLQVFFVFLAGILLGKKWGTISVAVWILLGLLGIPVFSQGKAGIMVLFGPTGGFLIGFLAATFSIGWYLETKKNQLYPVLISIGIGLFWIYCIGGIGFYFHSVWVIHNPLSWVDVFKYTVLPFLLLDICKGVFASLIGVKIRSILHSTGMDPQ
ncbi:MAG: biotin transporter BioY [Caldisericia bacterium]|nr:biotin transporter BioY [Caldisericia bacterium]